VDVLFLVLPDVSWDFVVKCHAYCDGFSWLMGVKMIKSNIDGNTNREKHGEHQV
jgi:hypothetical protein